MRIRVFHVYIYQLKNAIKRIKINKFTIIFLMCLCVVLTLMQTKTENIPKEKDDTSFGICSRDNINNSSNELRTVNEIDKSYKTDFWADVAFYPVPKFEINTHDPQKQDLFISASIQGGKIWDPYVWNLFLRVFSLQPPENNVFVIDVGANIGYFSLMAASMGYNVISFEPMTRNAAKFASSISKNHFEDKIILYQNAVGYDFGKIVHMTETHSTNQGNGRITTGPYNEHSITILLDDILFEPDAMIIMIKIDVEGFEASVLNGAKRLICMNIVRFITIEFSHETSKNEECPAVNMMKLLDSIGYEISDVVPGKRLSHNPPYDNFPPNILFTLKDYSMAPFHNKNIEICQF